MRFTHQRPGTSQTRTRAIGGLATASGGVPLGEAEGSSLSTFTIVLEETGRTAPEREPPAAAASERMEHEAATLYERRVAERYPHAS